MSSSGHFEVSEVVHLNASTQKIPTPTILSRLKERLLEARLHGLKAINTSQLATAETCEISTEAL